jgi:hypothetical protein
LELWVGGYGLITESKYQETLKLGPEATRVLASNAALGVQGTFSALNNGFQSYMRIIAAAFRITI